MFQDRAFWLGVFASALAFVLTVIVGGVTIN